MDPGRNGKKYTSGVRPQQANEKELSLTVGHLAGMGYPTWGVSSKALSSFNAGTGKN